MAHVASAHAALTCLIWQVSSANMALKLGELAEAQRVYEAVLSRGDAVPAQVGDTWHCRDLGGGERGRG